jgi:hypothetical protein
MRQPEGAINFLEPGGAAEAAPFQSDFAGDPANKKRGLELGRASVIRLLSYYIIKQLWSGTFLRIYICRCAWG